VAELDEVPDDDLKKNRRAADVAAAQDEPTESAIDGARRVDAAAQAEFDPLKVSVLVARSP
jgi:hypothetical protein